MIRAKIWQISAYFGYPPRGQLMKSAHGRVSGHTAGQIVYHFSVRGHDFAVFKTWNIMTALDFSKAWIISEWFLFHHHLITSTNVASRLRAFLRTERTVYNYVCMYVCKKPPELLGCSSTLFVRMISKKRCRRKTTQCLEMKVLNVINSETCQINTYWTRCHLLWYG